MRIYIVRHGRSTANDDASEYADAFGPGQPIPLTRLGMLQAQESGRQFAAAVASQPGKFNVYCSPFLRARQTCELFLQSGLEKQKRVAHLYGADELSEIHQGDFEGYSKEEDFAAFEKAGAIRHGAEDRPLTEADRQFMADRRAGKYYRSQPPYGMSCESLCEGAQRFIERERLTEQPQDVILFTHSFRAIALAACLTSPDADHLEETFDRLAAKRVKNGEILVVEGDKEHGFTVRQMPGIVIPKSLDDAPLTAKLASRRNPQHLTDYDAQKPAAVGELSRRIREQSGKDAHGLG